MTDYDAPGYASRFSHARRLDQQTHRTWVAALAEAVRHQPQDVVLDLGAGTGRFWPVLREAWRPRRIIAVDKSSTMLGAADPAVDITPIIMDVDELPGELPTVDACFCSMVLHYSRNPSAVCLRLRTVIRQGGILCIRSATTQTLSSFEFLRCFPTARAAEYAIMPDTQAVVGWMVEAGYIDVVVRKIETPAASGYWPYLRKVARRGFPSLQLVPTYEFCLGMIRLTVICAVRHLLGLELAGEYSLLVRGVCVRNGTHDPH